MNNPGNLDIEGDLARLPDDVADCLELWRKATLVREKCEALLYLQFKGEDKDRSATEIKAMVNSNGDRYQSMLNEIKAEAMYTRTLEKLLAAKKRASLRVAF